MAFEIPLIPIQKAASHRPSILIMYTGGTIGMASDGNDSLIPIDFKEFSTFVPELGPLNITLTGVVPFEPMDSSNMDPTHWRAIGDVINHYFHIFDAFVILHGTDTMAYTACALSYMLRNLSKPVILTGSQIPLGKLRTDARENLISSLEIAMQRKNGNPVVPEVCICFGNKLFRGNRSRKVQSMQFTAFESMNYPPLAQAGITIDYQQAFIQPHPGLAYHYMPELDPHVMILKLSPGLPYSLLKSILLHPDLKGVVLESYGAGNMPSEDEFLAILAESIRLGKVIVNASQCFGGSVVHGKYETSSLLDDLGVLSGRDITPEAAVVKLMHLFGVSNSIAEVRNSFIKPISGEMSWTLDTI